jgi:hypothetical protein
MSARPAYQPQRGQRPSLEFRPVADLQIDLAYQRSIDTGQSAGLIKRIAREWDWSLCQPLAVARRDDGGLFVIDGQHRLAAARQRGDIYDLPCIIAPSTSVDDEARHFVALNKQRRPLTALELHRAAVAAGNEEAQVIENALLFAGLSMAPHTKNSGWQPLVIGNVGGLQRTLRQHGEAVLKPALRVVSAAWPDEQLSYAGTIWPGIAACVAAIPPRERGGGGQLLATLLREAGQGALFKDICRIQVEHPGGLRQAAVEIVARMWREATEED